MSNEKKFEPAFPMDFEQRNDFQLGMSKRFYAACAAMQGILSSLSPTQEVTTRLAEQVSKESYMMADELLKQENK